MLDQKPPNFLADDLGDAAASLDTTVLLQGVLSGSGDCIKILDLEGRLQFMSEGGRRVMEVEDFGALKGCPWPGFWPGKGGIDAAEAVDAARRGNTSRFRGPANTAKGTPKFWDVTVSPIIDATGRPTHILSISKDITAEWKEAERQKFLTEELQHRIKNMMTAVISIAQQTFKGEAYQAPRAAFVERLGTLGRAHHLLSEASWRQAKVGEIVAGALSVHQFEKDAVHCRGPELELGPRQALALALATNELATNALKYGALKTPGGRVDIHWELGDSGQFGWRWRESGGPAVAAPQRTGFGARIIKDLLPAEFGGRSELRYDSGGFACTLTAPAETLLAP